MINVIWHTTFLKWKIYFKFTNLSLSGVTKHINCSNKVKTSWPHTYFLSLIWNLWVVFLQKVSSHRLFYSSPRPFAQRVFFDVIHSGKCKTLWSSPCNIWNRMDCSSEHLGTSSRISSMVYNSFNNLGAEPTWRSLSIALRKSFRVDPTSCVK